MTDAHAEFIARAAIPLGWFYALAVGLNLTAAVYVLRRRRWLAVGVWLGVAVGFTLLAWLACAGRPLEMPEPWKRAIDAVLGPVTFTLGSFALLTAIFVGRRLFVRPGVAWTAFNLSLLSMGASLTDPVFAGIVTRGDNLPIVGMVYLLALFTWLGAAQAVRNDERLRRGLAPIEADYRETVLVWPDLIYVELIGTVLGMAALIVWSLVVQAPLEAPANPVLTPNPSKAPWYFLGLQELLVYFDPAIAGVVLPGLIIFGLMAIPYLDVNRQGSGYYTIDQRKFAYVTFQFGFLGLWVLLILLGTFLRGPNWSFFGPYEPRDPYKVVAQNNVKLSEYFWVIGLGRPLPQPSLASGFLVQSAVIAWREIAGIVALAVYFIGLPVALGRTVFADLRRRMGAGRYAIMILLLAMMLMLPLKMILRWTLGLSYIVSVPEWYLNF